jgi:hypothetical protein
VKQSALHMQLGTQSGPVFWRGAPCRGLL